MNLSKTNKNSEIKNSELIEHWIKKATKWKAQKLPLEFTIDQAMMEFDMYRLGVRSEYHQKLEANELQRKEDLEQIQDIKDRYQHFVDAEKVTLQDQVFAKIDKLKVRLTNLKSRYNEQRKFQSKLKKAK